MITTKDVNALMELREMQKKYSKKRTIEKKYPNEIFKIEASILNAANNGKHQIFLKKYDTISIPRELQAYFKSLGFKVEEIEQPIKKRFYSDPEFNCIVAFSW